jgi:hypothetical protein
MVSFFIAMALATSPVAPLGKETVITNAGGGTLREWQAGPARSGIVYVRDRREQWYQVTLTGPCTTDTALDTLTYTTDVNGTFDRFSRIKVARYPNRICGISSIKTSLAPEGKVGLRKR